MAEARITEFFGETQIREEVLDFMGLGSCMPREAWRLPSPQMLHHVQFACKKNDLQLRVNMGKISPTDKMSCRTLGYRAPLVCVRACAEPATYTM